jgi:enoyl-CoA hydratase/carnithine racemase
VDLTRDGNVFTLDFGAGANAFNDTSLAEIFAVLDEVSAAGPVALVTTGSGKSYCQGLDLEWISAQSAEVSGRMVADVHRLYLRLLELPAYTVAAVNGHAFGGGAMLAISHDASYMKTGAGWWCLPEATLGMPFTPGMAALLKDSLPQPVVRRAMMTANRFTGPEAASHGIVTAAVDGDDLLAVAQAEAAAHAGVPGAFVVATRAALYADALRELRAIAENGLVWGA